MQMTNKPLLRLAHISDLHFSKITWSPSQFLSKRWLGNLNLLLTRKRAFAAEDLTTLFPIFHERKVDVVLVTGDLSSTSQKEEFTLARDFIDSLRQEKFKVFTLPGNHDHYTKSAYKHKLFYDFFDATYPSSTESLPALSLKEDGIAVTQLCEGWSLFALDTALATSLLSSNGYFSFELEQKLEHALKELPEGQQVILINHFPIFSNESHRKSLLRREALVKLLERFPKIKLFLHGHTHRHCIADLRSSNLPIILDSGSAAQKEGGTWNLIDLTPQGCNIEVFKNVSGDGFSSWEPASTSHFKW